MGTKSSFIKYGMDAQESQSNVEVIESEKGLYKAYYQNIFDVLSGAKNKLIVDAREALDVVRLIQLSYLSSKEKREIEFL